MAPLLHHDILLEVLRHCDSSTLCALMSVSRSLHDEAARSFLSDPVVFGECTDLESFIRFISVDNGRRLPYVRDLDIQLLWKSEDLHLSIGGMINLQRLNNNDAENLVENHPKLADAFAALEGIEQLVALNAGQLTCAMLRNMCSRLRSVRLTGILYPRDAKPDPVEALSGMTSSLEELECAVNWSHTHSDAPYPVFHKLRKFSIEGIVSPSTPRYAAAFPALTHLSILSRQALESVWREARPRFPADLYLRRNNMGLSHTWPLLQEISGDAGDVYNLGLRHPVPCLRLKARWAHQADSLLSTLLRDMRPLHLSLTVPDPKKAEVLSGGEEDARALASMLSIQSAATSIRCLELHTTSSRTIWSTQHRAAPLSGLLVSTPRCKFVVRTDAKLSQESVLVSLRWLPLDTMVIHWTLELYTDGERLPSYHVEERTRFVQGLLQRVPSLKTAELHWHVRMMDDYINWDEPVKVVRAARS